MKFSISALTSLVLATLTAAQIDLANPQEALGGEYVDPATMEPSPFKYDITYKILGHTGSVLEIYNGDEIALNYTVVNNEDEEINIVGVGGNFANPINGQVIANITDAKVGPIVIPAGGSQWFTQRVGVNLPAQNYALNPGLYVVKGSTLAMLGAQSTLAIISEKPISLFSPELLLLEALLIATLAIGGYVLYINFGVQYFKTAAKTAAPQKSGKASSVASGAEKKAVDESWLPDHIKKTNKKKAN